MNPCFAHRDEHAVARVFVGEPNYTRGKAGTDWLYICQHCRADFRRWGHGHRVEDV